MTTVTAYSTQGVRENNEDSFLTVEVASGRMTVTMYNDGYVDSYDQDTDLRDLRLYAVSDGMGGMEFGAEASYMTLSKLMDSIGRVVSSEDVATALQSTVREVSDKLFDNFNGSAGATLVGILVLGDRTYMFNTGDSYCAVIRGSEITWNKRHNCLNEAMEKGVECEDGMDNYLTDFIGKKDTRVDVVEIGDFESVLLCSDGLEPALRGEVSTSFLNLGSETLCSLALEKGSTDNVTCITIVGSP